MQPETLRPILSIVVPLYNMQNLIVRCLESMSATMKTLPEGDLEVLVVDDGSTDGSAGIVQDYAGHHAGFTLLRKTNGGHGSAVDLGRDSAQGLYLMVVDSDDLVVSESLTKAASLLRWLEERGVPLDLLVLDRLIEDEQEGTSRRQDFQGVFPVGRTFGWGETRRFRDRNFLTMHCLVFRSSLLEQASFRLPQHTSYEDALLVFLPLIHSRRLYYLPIPLYCYRIGREGQSVSLKVVFEKIDDHLSVSSGLAAAYGALPPGTPKQLERYLSDCFTAFLLVSLGLLTLSDRADRESRKKLLMDQIRTLHPKAYRAVAFRLLVILSRTQGSIGRFIVGTGRRVAISRNRLN